MSGKTAELYSEVFNYIEKNIFSMQPSQFMCDFETGLRSAIKKCYPSTRLYGCWFYYTSAIRRRMIGLHLYKLISEDANAATIYRMLLHLPLLPSGFISKGYKFMKNEARERNLHNVFKPIFTYFVGKYSLEKHISIAYLLSIYFTVSFITDTG